ncbi:MAG: ParA family protein [Pseudomonadota bacterium]|nr:ParA family protein [Pseudomonadota bacterium]MDE3037973.1 ParA family protein [Pseudomonadota bacterium]
MAKVITIAQQKGGAGKTTVAAHIAVALAQKGNRVAALDIDPQGSLSYWHGLREKRFGEGYTGLVFNALSGWRVGSEVARLRKQCDFIIIDSPPHTETEARTAVRSADFILIPVQPSPTDLWATKATLELAKAEKIPVKVLLNRVPANSRLAGIIREELTDLAETTLGSRVLFAAALMEGRAATEVEPGSRAAGEVKALVKEILALVKDEEEEEEKAPKARKKELVSA